MNTFKDLLRVVATSCGETIVIKPVSATNGCQYDIHSEPYRPKGSVTCNTVEILRFHFVHGNVRIRLPNHLRWYVFSIDDSLVSLSRIKTLPNGPISALLGYYPEESGESDADR